MSFSFHEELHKRSLDSLIPSSACHTLMSNQKPAHPRRVSEKRAQVEALNVEALEMMQHCRTEMGLSHAPRTCHKHSRAESP